MADSETEIDEDCSGEITREELEAYMKKKNYRETFVDKWLKIFDVDNSGTITIEEFCETLGLVVQDRYIEQVKTNREMANLQEGEVRIITIDPNMNDKMKDTIIQLARQAQRQFVKERDIAKFIKHQLDMRFFSNWHVVVGRFRYGTFVSHMPGCLFHFWVDRFAIIVWKTPDYSENIY